MPSYPIAYLRDDFEDNTQATVWELSAVSGSASKAETGGQAVFTLPASTAGVHQAYYQTDYVYTLTGDGIYIDIGTMISTSAAGIAFYDIVLNTSGSNNYLRISQSAGTISFIKAVNSVETILASLAYSSSTHRYWRIRENGGTTFWETSSNATTWTVRASEANPLAVTAVAVRFGAYLNGSVASPGSLRINSVNLISPALSSTWNWTRIEWPEWHRFRDVTLAATSGQGFLVSMKEQLGDGSWVDPKYWSGPLAVVDGVLTLTEYSSFAAAQAMAVNLPTDNRWTLPKQTDARQFILYHRSITGSDYIIREFYTRRLIQADDIEAEVFRGLRFEGHQFIADTLSALTADMGTLTAGTIIGATIKTSASGARVEMSGAANGGLIGYSGSDTYDPVAGTGTYQILWSKTDGKFRAGTGVVLLDANGIGITGATFAFDLDNPTPVTLPRINTIEWSVSGSQEKPRIVGSNTGQLLALADIITLAIPLNSQDSYGLHLQDNGAHSLTGATFTVREAGSTSDACLTVTCNITGSDSNVRVRGGLNVGSATGATAGQIKTDGLTSGNATFSVFSQTAASNAYLIDSNYGAGNLHHPGIVWTSSDNNATKPKAGVIPFFGSAGSDLYFGTSNNYGTGIVNLLWMNPAGDWLPGTTAVQNLGNATFYWNDVSYKTLTDRGCLGWFDEGVEMPDGSRVSDIEALMSIRPRTDRDTVYGVPMLDYASLPKAVYKPAPVAEEDTEIRGKKFKKGEKLGEDGAEMTALFSIYLGALKQMHREFDGRLTALEARTGARSG